MEKLLKFHRKISLVTICLVCLDTVLVVSSPVGHHTSSHVENTGNKNRDLDILYPSLSGPADSFMVLQQRASENFHNSGQQGFIKARPTEYEYNLVRTKASQNENSNVFIFCLMFLFGLIMSGLVWCLCAAGRNLARERQDGSRRSSRFSRMSMERPGANIHAIFPDTTDLPPAYNEIFSEFDKLGAQCILPSYKEIMSQNNLNLNAKEPPSTPLPTSIPCASNSTA